MAKGRDEKIQSTPQAPLHGSMGIIPGQRLCGLTWINQALGQHRM
jgi:hypothetical protein